ncbi:MAG: ribonuclease J [Desulfobacteraceae bacterium]|jgi:ribonuclease J|nr:ribonuclease J [Desulfobacteraceae bacterium]
MLKIVPMGGLGEIGLNMMGFEFGDTLFVVDAGLMFPEADMPGVDCVIPDMSYVKANRHRLAGLVLTHAHEDHIGALPYLLRDLNPPVFGTPFTLAMAETKLEAHGLLRQAALHRISVDSQLRLGPFTIEFIPVAHSVVDGVALAIRTPIGTVIHTGDFKISQTGEKALRTDVNRLARYGAEGVLALLSDSTNVEREGYTVSDEQVGLTLRRIVRGAPGRVIVALFASSISRIQQVVQAAEAVGRRVIFNGRSIETSVRIARDLGYLTVPEGMEATIDDLADIPDAQVLIVTTGSQGEPMAALARMAGGAHKQIQIRPGDTVVLSSKFIPGNERAIGRIINNLYRRGAEVIYEKISAIHVSGHAFREELKLMINLTRPRHFIPIHGEYRHLLLHARLAREVGIPPERVLLAENGQCIVFDQNGGRLGETVSTGRVLVDGKGIGDVGRSVLKERRLLSEDGLVVVTMAIGQETGIIVFGPDIVSRGFVFETATGHILDDAVCVVLEVVEETDPAAPDRTQRLRSGVQHALRKYFEYTIRRRPVILPFIMEI